MTALSSYSTGTATVSAGGTTVTGTGTIWSGTSVKPGDIFQIGNFQSVITDVTDTTHLVIPPWGGGAQTLSGFITNPAGNLRISVADNAGSPSGQIMFNNSGLSKDCVISAMKLA